MTCPICNGTGKKIFPVLADEDGELKVIEVKIICEHCRGKGRIKEEEEK